MIPKPPQNPHNVDECRIAALEMLMYLATTIVVTWALGASDGHDVPEGILCINDLGVHLKEMHANGFLCTRDYHANLVTLVTLAHKGHEEIRHRIHLTNRGVSSPYSTGDHTDAYLVKVFNTLEELVSICEVVEDELTISGIDNSASGSHLHLYSNGPVFTFHFDP